MLSGRVIAELCHRAQRDGRKRNSVRRYMLRAISLLLRHYLGEAERNRIFAEVAFPAEDDTREVHLRDSKTEGRSRSVPLTDGLCRELLALSKGKRPDDAVFSTSYLGLDLPWKRVRKAAALEHVRFKDLRAQISIYGEEAGIPLTVLSKTMGHAGEAMTRRYQQRAAVLSNEQAEAIERAMLAGEEGNRVRRAG